MRSDRYVISKLRAGTLQAFSECKRITRRRKDSGLLQVMSKIRAGPWMIKEPFTDYKIGAAL